MQKENDGAIADDELELTLRVPISSGDVQYETITLTEPLASQIAQFTKDIDKYGAIDAQIKFVSVNAKVPEGAVRKLRARDFKKASEFLASFL